MSAPLRQVLAQFGFDIDSAKLEAGIKKTDGFASSLKTLADKVVGGSLGDAIKDWVGDVKEAAGEFKGLAKLTGTSAQDMQRWTTAAKLGGSSVEALSQGFRVLQKNQAAAAHDANSTSQEFAESGDGALEAALSGKKAAEAFKALGVDVRDSKGELKSTTQLMGDVGLAIASIKNPAERAAVATRVLGRQGAALLPLFSQGEEGLSKLLDKIDELGGGVGEDALKALSENSKAAKEYDVALLSLKATIVTQVLPAMTGKVKALTQIVAWFNRTQKGTEIVKSATIVLGGAFLVLQRQAIASAIKTAIAWAPTVITFALLALVVDDVITALNGGDSVLGAWFGKLEKINGGKNVFADMGRDARSLQKDLAKIPDIGGKIEEVFSSVGASIVKFFVDDIPEAASFLWKDIKKGWNDFDAAATNVFKSIVQTVVQGAKDIANNLVDGIVNGLKEAWSRVTDTVGNLGERFIQAFRDVFKIRSPSARLEAETDFIPMGVIKSLAKWAPAVQDQAQETWAGVLPVQNHFAPLINVPRLPQAATSAAGARHIQVETRSENTIVFQGGTVDRNAIRDGLKASRDDQQNALLSALEDQVD